MLIVWPVLELQRDVMSGVAVQAVEKYSSHFQAQHAVTCLAHKPWMHLKAICKQHNPLEQAYYIVIHNPPGDDTCQSSNHLHTADKHTLPWPAYETCKQPSTCFAIESAHPPA